MQSIDALSLAPDVNAWLANSRHSRILHVFDRACNLINERGNILSIVTQQIGNGPFNLVVADDILFSDYLDAQSRISIRGDQLCLGDLTVNTDNAKLWHPRPDWKALHSVKDNILDELILLPITSYQPSLPSSLLATFSAALASADISTALSITRRLAGLGQGLTPAGDDFILGAVLAAWIIHPFEIASFLASEITNAAAPLTTSLSAAWLKSAGKGDASILWHQFFDALRVGNPSSIQLQISKLLSIGHTSGADALAGFIGTITSYVESETKLCPS